jgi:hypothetical protein
MRRLVVLLLVVAAVASIRATAPAVGTFAPQKGPATIPGPPLAIVWQLHGRDAVLTRLDPSTLAPAGRRVVLGRSVSRWAYDPTRSWLAFAINGVTVRFVDADGMRVLGDVRAARNGARLNFLTWLFPNRFLAVSWSSARAELVWIDATKRRVVARGELDTLPWNVVGGGSMAVALLAPPQAAIAGARLAVVGGDGSVRVVRVPRIQIGFAFPDRRDRGYVRRVSPGLAVTPGGERAFLVGGAGVVAEVDLHTLAVSYHSPQRARSFASRIGSWLVPAAQAKGADGPWMHARWLGNGVIAVTGARYHLVRPESRGLRQIVEPAGLRLIDTRRWTQRTLDERAGGFTLAGDTIIAYGVRSEWVGTQPTLEGMGVAAYGPDGAKRFEALAGEPIGLVQASSGRGYAWRSEPGSQRKVVVIGVADGQVEGEVTLEHPTWLLLESDGS